MVCMRCCADVANGVDTVFISRNDRLYRPPSARNVNSSLYAVYQPYFVCSVRRSRMSMMVSAASCAELAAPVPMELQARCARIQAGTVRTARTRSGVTGAGGAQVINLDSQARVSYRLEADLINNQVALVSDEQQALANIFAQCAPAP